MNKTEALEAVLEVMREHETPDGGGLRVTADQVEEGLDALVHEYLDDEGTDDAPVYLIRIAAAALTLLVDEREVVTGRTLDEWLAAGEDEVENFSGDSPDPLPPKRQRRYSIVPKGWLQ